MVHLYDNRTLDPHTGTRQSLLRNSPVRRGKVGMIGYVSGAKCCVGEDSFSGFFPLHRGKSCCISLGKCGINGSPLIPLAVEPVKGVWEVERGKTWSCPPEVCLSQEGSGGSVIRPSVPWSRQQWGTLWLPVLVISVAVTEYHRPSGLVSRGSKLEA